LTPPPKPGASAMTPQQRSCRLSPSRLTRKCQSPRPKLAGRHTRVGRSRGVVASIPERWSSHGRTDVGGADVDPWMAAWTLAVARRLEHGGGVVVSRRGERHRGLGNWGASSHWKKNKIVFFLLKET
jgi:hypothetical protein